MKLSSYQGSFSCRFSRRRLHAASRLVIGETVTCRRMHGVSALLSQDLQGYAYALINLGLRLRELNGDDAYARIAFEQAEPHSSRLSLKENATAGYRFHFVMAAAAITLRIFQHEPIRYSQWLVRSIIFTE